MKYGICGIGNAIVDISINLSEEDFSKLGLEKGRMYLTDPQKQKELREKLENTETSICSGGSAANSIIAIAAHGIEASYMCSVASDLYGDKYIEDLEQQGADFRGRVKIKGETGTSIILITPDAERTMNTHLGVSVELGPDDIDPDVISQSKWVYIEGYLLSSPHGHDLVNSILDKAKSSKTKVALTLSDVFIVEQNREYLNSIANDLDLVFANVYEAMSLLEEDNQENVYSKMASKFKNIAITYGASGAKVLFDGEEATSPAGKVKAVDMTGAGDMFAGTLLSGIVLKSDLQSTTQRACMLASKLVGVYGARLPADQMEI